MKAETLAQLRIAAGLACQLRSLLEEIEQDLKEDGNHELAWDFEDMASSVNSVEGDLDIHVETHS